MRSALLLLSLAAAGWAQVPRIAEGGVLNGASFTRGQPVAPGSLISLFGSDLAARLAQGDSIPLSTTIDDVFVTVNGIRAPLYFVSAGQINAQLPWEAGGSGTAAVIVNRGGAASAPATVSLTSAAPGLIMVSGSTQAIAVNSADGTLAAPPGSIAGLETHGARAGDVLILYATGLGAVMPPVRSGANSVDELRRTVVTPVVMIGGVAATVAFSGLSPQFVGVNQLNVVVPAGVTAGPGVPIQIQANGMSHTANIAIIQ